MSVKIVIATGNQGKLKEIGTILKMVSEEFIPVPVKEIAPSWRGVEEGSDYFFNTLYKAASLLPFVKHEFILAEDSGLEVFALGMKPGPFSSRYGGENASDREKIELLLSELQGVKDRSCRYVCSAVIMNPRGQYLRGWGEVKGVIANSPSGEGGFGYDPVFYLPDRGKTFAEIPLEEKCRISHRAVAIRDVIQKASKFNFFEFLKGS